MELPIVKQGFVFDIFKIHRDNLVVLNTTFFQICPEQQQQGGFSATSDTRDHLNDFLVFHFFQLVHILRSLNHFEHLSLNISISQNIAQKSALLYYDVIKLQFPQIIIMKYANSMILMWPKELDISKKESPSRRP